MEIENDKSLDQFKNNKSHKNQDLQLQIKQTVLKAINEYQQIIINQLNELYSIKSELRSTSNKQKLDIKSLKPKQGTEQIVFQITKDEVPVECKYYQKVCKNMKNVENQKVLTICQQNMFYSEINQDKFQETFKHDQKLLFKHINSVQRIHPQDKHKLYYICEQILIEHGPKICNNQCLATILNKNSQQLYLEFWLPLINKHKMSDIQKLIETKKNKIKPYKYARQFCSICCKFDCTYHVLLVPEDQSDLYFDPYQPQEGYCIVDSEVINENTPKINYPNLMRCIQKDNCHYTDTNLSAKLNNYLDLKKYVKESIRFLNIWNIQSPCFIAKLLNQKEVSCREVGRFLKYISYEVQNRPENQNKRSQLQSEYQKNKQRKENQKIQEKFFTHDYIPCYHKGKCTKENCICYQKRGKCEKFCGCSKTCLIKFPGCLCISECGASCICSLDRECDADFCACNCYRNNRTVKIQGLKVPICQNSNLTYKWKPRLLLQKSLVCEGLGIIAGQHFQKGEYIGEYTGLIDLQEQQQDHYDEIYTKADIHYIFNLGYTDTIIDPYGYGNKLRFVNYAQYDLDNAVVKYIYCNGSIHIILKAKDNKEIFLGQEIFFDYGDAFTEKVPCIKEFKEECRKWFENQRKSKNKKDQLYPQFNQQRQIKKKNVNGKNKNQFQDYIQ